MYSLILMTAMSAAPDTTEFNGFFRNLFSFRGGSCHGCNGGSGCGGGSCYGSCTGRSSGGYGSCTGCCGGGCYGNGRMRAFTNNSCYGSCTGKIAAASSSCTGYGSCHGSLSYSCLGSAPSGGYEGFAVPSPAISQYPVMESGSCFGSSGGSGIPMPMSGPIYDNGGYIPATPMPATPQSYNPPDSVSDQRNSLRVSSTATGRATVIVRLPADARLYAENRQLSLTSAERQFVTPLLPSDGEYSYTFRAEYVRNGETISQTKRINVRSGHTYPVEFNDLTSAKNAAPSVSPTPSVPMPSSLNTEYASKPVPSLAPVPAPAPFALNGQMATSTKVPSVPAPESTNTATTNAATVNANVPRNSAAERARITVKLPAGATLYVDGKKNERSELVREFNTPLLPPGQDYAYMMKAELIRSGQPESQTIKVVFRAGEITSVDFTHWPSLNTNPATNSGERASR